MQDALRAVSASTPVVVFAHIPLSGIYLDWGWGTKDSEQAFSYLKRFGSVTVLNGHIHQLTQKAEGNATFHTAMSTAFPQPAPRTAPSPGPLKVPAETLRIVLGLANPCGESRSLAVVDLPLRTTQGSSASLLRRDLLVGSRCIHR
jgi:Icc protein